MWKPIQLAVGCASSSSSWDLLKCYWNVGQLCYCAGRLSHSRMSWVKTPARCKMIIPILISCSLVDGDFSADTTAPATYYENSEAASATQMNQHIQQLAQTTQQNTHMQSVLQNRTSQVTNLQNQLNNAPQPTQQHPGYKHQAYPAFTPAPDPYQQPPPSPYQPPPLFPLPTRLPLFSFRCGLWYGWYWWLFCVWYVGCCW